MPTRAVFASRCATGSNFFPLCLNGAAAAFQGRSDLIGAPFFILWKLCSAQQCRTRAELFSTEVFMRSPARTGTELPDDHPGFDPRDDSLESDLSQLGDSLCWPAGVCTPPPSGM